MARDKYGRTVGKVTVDGEDVGKRLKREGHAKPRAPRRRK
ncbi:MAG: thermonuclease family protein [candidate division NC10 bacterium]|nr:thermonuclease family protein [candidate division NC10 bacterium]